MWWLTLLEKHVWWQLSTTEFIVNNCHYPFSMTTSVSSYSSSGNLLYCNYNLYLMLKHTFKGIPSKPTKRDFSFLLCLVLSPTPARTHAYTRLAQYGIGIGSLCALNFCVCTLNMPTDVYMILLRQKHWVSLSVRHKPWCRFVATWVAGWYQIARGLVCVAIGISLSLRPGIFEKCNLFAISHSRPTALPSS